MDTTTYVHVMHTSIHILDINMKYINE